MTQTDRIATSIKRVPAAPVERRRASAWLSRRSSGVFSPAFAALSSSRVRFGGLAVERDVVEGRFGQGSRLSVDRIVRVTRGVVGVTRGAVAAAAPMTTRTPAGATFDGTAMPAAPAHAGIPAAPAATATSTSKGSDPAQRRSPEASS